MHEEKTIRIKVHVGIVVLHYFNTSVGNRGSYGANISFTQTPGR
jgi:hypothetical protein